MLGRRALLAATNSGPSDGPIVTTGLVLNLDAGNPASYPGSGTTWTDLSGNGNNGTLTGTGVSYTDTNVGKMLFSGSGGYVNLANPASLQFGTGDYTVEVFTRPSVINTAGDGRLIISKGFPGGVEFAFFDNDFYLSPSTTAVGTGWSVNTWYHIVSSRISGSQSTYRNAISIGAVSNTSNVTNGTVPFVVGARAGGGGGLGAGPYAGYIPIIRMYNRGLSAAEVSQNFNANRGRYGI